MGFVPKDGPTAHSTQSLLLDLRHHATQWAPGLAGMNVLIGGEPAEHYDFIRTVYSEFPILLVGLSMVGIVTSQRLSSMRRMVILGIAIFSAVVTPGGDLVSPFVLGITMYILFELTIIFIRRSGR